MEVPYLCRSYSFRGVRVDRLGQTTTRSAYAADDVLRARLMPREVYIIGRAYAELAERIGDVS